MLVRCTYISEHCNTYARPVIIDQILTSLAWFTVPSLIYIKLMNLLWCLREFGPLYRTLTLVLRSVAYHVETASARRLVVLVVVGQPVCTYVVGPANPGTLEHCLPLWVVSVADCLKSSASCTSLCGEFGRCCSNARSFGYKHTSILHTRSSEKFDDMLFYSQTVKTDGRTDEFAIAISRSACIALPMRYMVSSG